MANLEEEQAQEKDVITISFRDILYTIRKHIIVVLACIVAFIAGGVVYSKVIPPEYSATGTVIVAYESNNEASSTQYNFANYIANTFVVFMKEDIVIDRVAEKTGVSNTSLKEGIKISADSLIISVSYVCDDGSQAINIVNTLLSEAQEVADTKNVDGTPKYKMLNNNLKVLSAAKKSEKVSSTLKSIAIFGVIGVVVAAAYVVIRELTNTHFKSPDEVERILDLPVFAGIPYYEFDNNENQSKEGK